MVQLLGLVLISFAVTGLLLVPFIDLLFYLREKYRKSPARKLYEEIKRENTPIHDKLLIGKDTETPVGGGILLIPIVVILSLFIINTIYKEINKEIYILVFTFISFGLIGFIDDIKKIFTVFTGKFIGLRARYLLLLQIFFAGFVGFWLYSLGLNNIFIPILGNIILGVWYIPLAVVVIIAFSNAYNIADGLDGLAAGLLTICLFAFLALAHAAFNPTLSIFVGVWIGALIAFLYFNVFPARIYLGDAGAFAFGATLALVGLLTGKIIGLAVIGGVYIIIVGSSLSQIISKRIFKKKIMAVAPLHMYFKYIGWEEPKIVFRFWLAGSIFAIFGLFLALSSH